MKKYISILMTVACLSLSAASFTSCQSTGGLSGAVTSAQSWLSNPANQAMIQQIAQTAIGLAGLFGKHGAASRTTIVGKLAAQYPNVPAGALEQIAANPTAYAHK